MFVEKAIFVTAEVDVTMMRTIKAVVPGGPRPLMETMLNHGRFKKPTIIKVTELTDLKRDATKGLLEFYNADGLVVKAKIPDRGRLDEVAKDVARAWKTRTAPLPAQ